MNSYRRLLTPAGRITLLALAALIAASLACGPTASTPQPLPATAAPTTAPVEAPTTAPAQPPTNTPLPPPPTPQSAGGKPTTVPPPTVAAGDPAMLTVENVSRMVELLDGEVDEITLLAADASPVSHEVATFGADAIVRIWDLDSGDLLHEMPGHSASGFALKYSWDGTLLASGGGDYRVRIWDTATGTLLNTIIVNSNVYRLIWSTTGDGIGVVGEGSSRVELFEPLTGNPIGQLQPSNRVLWSAAVSPDNMLIASADNDGNVAVFDSQTFDLVIEDTVTASGAGWDLEFSPDGTLLASCNDGGGVYIWTVSDMAYILGGEVHNGDCVDGVFSNDSRVYFSAGEDGELFAWDVASGDALLDVDLGPRIWTISLTGDGHYLVAAMDDGSLRVWGLP